MSQRMDDRYLWLGVGIGLIVAFKGIKYAIEDTVRLTQVKPLGKDQDEELQRQPEDCKTPPDHYDMPFLTLAPSNPSRRPPHPRRLPPPQHQQMRHRHRPHPLCEKPRSHIRSASGRSIFKPRPAPQSSPRYAITRQLESWWRRW